MIALIQYFYGLVSCDKVIDLSTGLLIFYCSCFFYRARFYITRS